MKTITVSLLGMAIILPSSRGAMLLLQAPGPAPDAAGLHADFYHLPTDLLANGSPMVAMEFWLKSLSEDPRNHVMVNANPGGVETPIRDAALLGTALNNDTHLLFDPTQVTISDVVESETLFSATVVFLEPIDTLPSFEPPHPVPGADFGALTFLRSVNTDFGIEDGLTDLALRVTYADGSVREFADLGIIPEPSRGLVALLGMAAAVLLRRRTGSGRTGSVCKS